MDEQTKNKLLASTLQQYNVPSYQQDIIKDYINQDIKSTLYIMMPRHSGKNYLKDRLYLRRKNIVTTLVWGDALAGVISRPIAAWRGSRNVIDGEKLAGLIDVMNQRICDLEEKIDGESK